MDSGNSGSIQSSSGGEEEYDSRSRLNNPSGHFVGSFSSSNLNPPTSFISNYQPTTTFFDPHSQNLDSNFLNTTSNPQYNINNDVIWPRGLRSEPNFSNLGNLSSSSTTPAQGGLTQVQLSESLPIPIQLSVEPDLARGSNTNVVKNSKKRTRASRRAPTTVLTTDTTNFRQMVQEFTGIPTAPFTGVSSPYSRRLDLFSTPGGGSAMRSGHLDALGPLYTLRPSSPFIIPSSSTNMVDHNSLMQKDSDNVAKNTSFQLGTTDNLGISKEAHKYFNMHNQVLQFHDEPSLRPSLDYNQENQHVGGGYKLNSSTSSSTSDFHPEKGLEQ